MSYKLSYTGEKIDDLLTQVNTGSIVTSLTDDIIDPTSEYPVSGIAVGALHLTLLATEGDTEGSIIITDDDSRHNRGPLWLFWDKIQKGSWNDNTPVFLAVRSKEGSTLLTGKINIASSYGITLVDKTSQLAKFWFALPINNTLEEKRVLKIYFIVEGTTISRVHSGIDSSIALKALDDVYEAIGIAEIEKYRYELIAINAERDMYAAKYSAMEKLSGKWVAYSSAYLQFKLYLQDVINGTADIDSRYNEYRSAYNLAKAALDGYSVIYSEEFKDLSLDDCPKVIEIRMTKELWKIEKEKIANELRQLRAEYYLPNATQNATWTAYQGAWGIYNLDLAVSINAGNASATLLESKANYESAKSGLSALPKNSDYIISIVKTLESSGIVVPTPTSTE